MAKKRILVAPLDWGLGHATRSIPVIRALLDRGCEVLLGSNSRPLALLRKEFPELETLELPPYDVRYPTSNIFINVGYQAPRLVKTIAQENLLMRKLAREGRIDGIISDHRLGCSHPTLPNVVIAHQLHLRLENSVMQWPVRQAHYKVLAQFQECWVPDYEDVHQSISGDLDHPPLDYPPTRYVGPLSRLRKIDLPLKYDLLILLSGPEPQRTRLEEKLRRQASALPEKVLLVQGKTDAEKTQVQEGNLTIISYLTSGELEQAIAESGFVVCRSGYSTVLDLAACGKKAMFIPTPGQTEQEYLAEYLAEKGFFWHRSQVQVDLERDLPRARSFSGFPLTGQEDLLSPAIDDFLIRVEAFAAQKKRV